MSKKKRGRRVEVILRPEYDFLENFEYLDDLVKRINRIKKIDSIVNNKDFLQEIMQADYYVNRLIRLGDSNSSFDKNTLEEMSAVFQEVLDTVQSKQILTLHHKEDEENCSRLYDYSDEFYMFDFVFKCVFTLVILFTLLTFVFNKDFVRKTYNTVATAVNNEDIFPLWEVDEEETVDSE